MSKRKNAYIVVTFELIEKMLSLPDDVKISHVDISSEYDACVFEIHGAESLEKVEQGKYARARVEHIPESIVWKFE